MDIIYSHAQLTIIAAAGSGSDYGLPGVGARPRHPVKRHMLGQIEFEEIVVDFKDEGRLISTPWAQRGWTLQEGLLSKRRLIFTNRQTSFICGHMCCTESTGSQIIFESREVDLYFAIMNGLRRTLGLPVNRENHREIYRVIENYTDRILTYDTDILNACRGVLNNMCGFHVWGMPLESDRIADYDRMNLVWTLESLDNGHETLRRPNFPSWSWTGWRGRISFPRPYYGNLPSCRILLSAANEEWQTMEEFMNKHHGDRTSRQLEQPTLLRITAPRVYSRLFRCDEQGSQRRISQPQLLGKVTAFLRSAGGDQGKQVDLFLDQPIAEDEIEDVVYLVLCHPIRFGMAFGIILRPKGCVYERVGYMSAIYPTGNSRERDSWSTVLEDAQLFTIDVA